MVDIQANPNSIYISIIPTGCCKAELDSTYPIHLNGIISPDEFGESIKKINDASTLDKTSCTILVIRLGYGNNRVQLVHHLVIDIGRSTVHGNEVYSSNKVAHQSISLVGQQDNSASPSYPDQSTRF